MFRPFVFIGIGAIAASFALLYSTLATAFCLGFMALITIVFIVSKKNSFNKGVIIALIFVILAARTVTLGATVDNKTKALSGETVDIKAQIISVDYNSDSFASLSLKVVEATNSSANGIKVKATLMSHTNALPGDIISARAVFATVRDEYRASNFGAGYYYAADISKIYSYESKESSLWRMVYNIRNAVSSAINSSGKDEESAVLNALIIGDKSEVSSEFLNATRSSGVSHMLVVSGMHLGILCGVMMNLMKKRMRVVPSIIVGSLVTLFMLTVCLFHVSILRASIAYIIMLLARLFKRNADSLSALGFGIAVAVIITPYIFYNVAFLLSISATFAVLYPARILINLVSFKRFGRLGKLFRYAYDILIISVCAIFCTLPVAVSCFGYVALAAPITNLMVSLAISCALIMGVFAVMLFFLPFGSYISLPFFFVSKALIAFFISAVEFIGKNSFGVVNVGSDKNIYCFVVTIAFILLVKLLNNTITKRKEKKLC